MNKKPLVYVIYYSTFGHLEKLAHSVLKGVVKSGADVKLFQFGETLSEDILLKMNAKPKNPNVPVITAEQLPEADGFCIFLK